MYADKPDDQTYWRALFKPRHLKSRLCLGKKRKVTTSVYKVCPSCKARFRTVATTCPLCAKQGETVSLEQLFKSTQNAMKTAQYRVAKTPLNCRNCRSYMPDDTGDICCLWNVKIKPKHVCDRHTIKPI